MDKGGGELNSYIVSSFLLEWSGGHFKGNIGNFLALNAMNIVETSITWLRAYAETQ